MLQQLETQTHCATLTIFVMPVGGARACAAMAVFAMEARWVVRSFVSMGLKAVCRVPRPHHHLQVAVHSLLDVSKVDRRRELVVVMAVEESQYLLKPLPLTVDFGDHPFATIANRFADRGGKQ